MGSAVKAEAPRRSLAEVVEGVRRHETRLSALVRAYEAAEGEDDGITDLLRDRGWDAAQYLWDVEGAAKDDRLRALWTAEDPNIGRVVWILPAVLYALEPYAGTTSFRFRDMPLRQWIVYALNECCDFMAKWLRGVGEDAVEAEPDTSSAPALHHATEALKALAWVPPESDDTPFTVTQDARAQLVNVVDTLRAEVEVEGAHTGRDGSGDDGTPDEDADAGVPLPRDCTHRFMCQGCGLFEADRDTRHLLALMETATKEAERLHGRLPAEEAETFKRSVFDDLENATACFREIVDERFDQPAGDLEALSASLRER